MAMVLVLLVVLSAPLQAAITTALVRDPLAAPVIPVVLVAAWGAVRRPDETWPAILLPAVVLGVASEERVGWFLLALLPAPLIATLGAKRFKRHATGFWRRVTTAGLAAGAAAACYGTVLALAGGLLGELPERSGALLATATESGVLAVLVALCLWPFRPRQRGLFE